MDDKDVNSMSALLVDFNAKISDLEEKNNLLTPKRRQDSAIFVLIRILSLTTSAFTVVINPIPPMLAARV